MEAATDVNRRIDSRRANLIITNSLSRKVKLLSEHLKKSYSDILNEMMEKGLASLPKDWHPEPIDPDAVDGRSLNNLYWWAENSFSLRHYIERAQTAERDQSKYSAIREGVTLQILELGLPNILPKNDPFFDAFWAVLPPDETPEAIKARNVKERFDNWETCLTKVVDGLLPFITEQLALPPNKRKGSESAKVGWYSHASEASKMKGMAELINSLVAKTGASVYLEESSAFSGWGSSGETDVYLVVKFKRSKLNDAEQAVVTSLLGKIAAL